MEDFSKSVEVEDSVRLTTNRPPLWSNNQNSIDRIIHQSQCSTCSNCLRIFEKSRKNEDYTNNEDVHNYYLNKINQLFELVPSSYSTEPSTHGEVCIYSVFIVLIIIYYTDIIRRLLLLPSSLTYSLDRVVENLDEGVDQNANAEQLHNMISNVTIVTLNQIEKLYRNFAQAFGLDYLSGLWIAEHTLRSFAPCHLFMHSLTVEKIPVLETEDIFKNGLVFHTPYFRIGSPTKSFLVTLVLYFNPMINEKYLCGFLMVPTLPDVPFEGSIHITLFHPSPINLETDRDLEFTKTVKLHDSIYRLENIFSIDSFFPESGYINNQSVKFEIQVVEANSDSLQLQYELHKEKGAQQS